MFLLWSRNLHYWPDCAFTGDDAYTGSVHLACAVGIGAAPSTYTGRMATVEFTCAADGSITLVHGEPDTYVADDNATYYAEASDETLTINCVDPAPYPGDTDGDGCPDMREAGPNQVMGGMRNFLNPWDYYDATGDHRVRVDDLLLLNQHYGLDAGQPGYDVRYDRTYIGPNKWNLGPPNGKIRVDDILAESHQYGHDCM